jgi:hypothetical protein
MCVVIPAAMLAYATIASTVAATAAAKIAANKQADALSTQAQVRANQITEQASAQLGVRARQARIDQGRAEVAGGESGLTGQSYEANLNNITEQENTDRGTILTNANNSLISNTQDEMAAGSRIQQPNYAGAVLGIANQVGVLNQPPALPPPTSQTSSGLQITS